jgi:hypothetical protein
MKSTFQDSLHQDVINSDRCKAIVLSFGKKQGKISISTGLDVHFSLTNSSDLSWCSKQIYEATRNLQREDDNVN